VDSQAVPSTILQERPRTIVVVGRGRAHLEPDVGEVNVGEEASADSTSEAKAEVDRQMAAVFAALEEVGEDREDIQTSHVSIHSEGLPKPPAASGPPDDSQRRYRVSNMLSVSVRDAERTGDVLDAAVNAGANQVIALSFTASDESEWQREVREKAMAEARARGSELAAPAGVELGEVQSRSEIAGNWPMPMEL
jgi:uncharacterized protein YggE